MLTEFQEWLTCSRLQVSLAERSRKSVRCQRRCQYLTCCPADPVGTCYFQGRAYVTTCTIYHRHEESEGDLKLPLMSCLRVTSANQRRACRPIIAERLSPTACGTISHVTNRKRHHYFYIFFTSLSYSLQKNRL